MGKFAYLARDGNGTAVNGEIVAASQSDAAQLLRAEGKFVVKLREYDETAELAQTLVSQGRRKVRGDETIFFATQLAGMVETGVPIAEALEATIDKAPPGAFRRTIEDVIARVQGGAELSTSLAAHPKVFSPMFVHMVKASESSGTLGVMLNRVAEYLINQREIRKKIKSALMYPACMMVLAFGAMIFIMTFVLPQFANIYAGKSAVLPLPTRILMAVSHWIVSDWYMPIAGVVLLLSVSYGYFRSERGRYAKDWLTLHVPVLGPMFQLACVTRALRTLGAMITAGVPVLEAVPITRDVVGNRMFGKLFDDACRRMESGDQLSSALGNTPLIPRNIWQMIRAGERTGKVGPTMNRVAEICETDLRDNIRTMTQFIEPVMIGVIGTMIGGIAISVLMPIFQISRIMAQ